MQHPINPSPTKRIRGNPRFATTHIINAPMAQRNFVAVRTTGSKRPVDKLLVNVNHQGTDATQVTTTLTTATFPCTIVGLRWDMTILPSAGTVFGSYAWAIVILRDGVTVSTMAISDGATLYAPEQDVMAFGRGVSTASALGMLSKYMGSTKTMRKLMGGDKLLFLFLGEATNTSTLEGCIQFFCKT